MPPKRKSRKRSRHEPPPEDLIDENHREEILDSFQGALKSGQKKLSISAAKKSLKHLGIDTKSDEVQEFLNNSRQDETIDSLDRHSYLRFAATKLIQIENAHKAFGLMDKDEKGIVVVEDLRRVAQELGEDISDEQLQEMVDLVDRSGDGFLGPDDFVRIARKVNL